MVQSALEGTHSTYAFLCPSFSALLDVTNSFNRSVGWSIFVSSPVGTHDHIFILFKAFTCVEMGAMRTDPGTGSSIASIAVDSCWASLASVALTETSTTLNPSFKIRHYIYYGFTIITYIANFNMVTSVAVFSMITEVAIFSTVICLYNSGGHAVT